MAVWKSLELQIPGKDLLEPARNVLETLVIYLEVLKAILDTIKVFLADFGNPIKALVEALIKLIEELLLSLLTSGAFGYFDIPDLTRDPGFVGYKGGYPAFLNRFSASLFDQQDYNRPQPRQGSTSSGFVLMVVESPDAYLMFLQLKALLNFFGKSFELPRLKAPANAQALPVGNSGDPITALAKLFTDGPIKALELKWTLASTQEVPNPGFTDLLTKAVSEMVPPNFLIERATVRPVQQVDVSENPDLKFVTSTDEAGNIDLGAMASTAEEHVGVLTKLDPTGFTDSSSVTHQLLRRAPVLDSYGEPFIKFNRYYILDSVSLSSLLGELGTYRWIDTDVKEGVTYWYRIRAFRGSLDYDATSKMIKWQQVVPSNEQGRKILEWPSADNEVVMGHCTGILQASVPTVVSSAVFDVMDLVQRTFLLAYCLDFQAPQTYPDWTFDGLPQAPTPANAVGLGSVAGLAGDVENYRAKSDIDFLKLEGPVYRGADIRLPIQLKDLNKQASRITHNVVVAMMGQGTTGATPFRNLLEGPMPKALNQGEELYPNLKAMIKVMTYMDEDGNTTVPTQLALVGGYYSVGVRANLQVAIDYLRGLALGGVEKNWISVVPLRDIIPWCGQLIYDLLGKIEALLAAFSGVMKEISNFIDLLERKIQALEDFLAYLIRILNFVEALQFDAYFLGVKGLNTGPQGWIDAIKLAGGTPPNSNPANYAAGISFAYSAVNPVAFEKAFGIIFGSF